MKLAPSNPAPVMTVRLNMEEKSFLMRYSEWNNMSQNQVLVKAVRLLMMLDQMKLDGEEVTLTIAGKEKEVIFVG